MHFCLLTLGGLFLSVFFGHMPSHQTAADRADHRVVPGVMPRDSADDRSLHAPGRVRRADHCRRECYCREGGSYISSFHLKVPCC
ncbi:exported hypothetical protein [Paraburkholderia ribeironis]|uniref:Uncharacterized protein n=1 Tax=Paraburkholderia ribeironis TaxID=1247936 RepID=A0A1N7SP90_9BURK|nr:exported hypothetical protein [Paraburkholderia ribeironis]